MSMDPGCPSTKRHATVPSSLSSKHKMSREAAAPGPASATFDMQQYLQLPEAPCSSPAYAALPTTLTSDIWERLPNSSQQLMQEALTFVDSEFELDVTPTLETSSLQWHPSDSEAGHGAAARSAPKGSGKGNKKLDVVSVVRIFLAKYDTPWGALDRGLSTRLAAEFGVSNRAVRDIWNKRTWTSVTKYL